ncbi:MAG TPA: lipopolysaccharide biosynthesis protein [Armatimonadota bacterium]|nr:lipopolysaccharide biosynthesis protein [Armatimonadota bacterium]
MKDNDQTPPPRSLAGSTVSSTAWTISSRLGVQVISLIAMAFLARLLDPSDFGLIAMVLTVTGLLDTVSSLGLSAAAIQRKDLTRDQSNMLFWINAGLGVLFTIITVALAPAMVWFYKRAELTTLAPVLALNFAVVGLSVQPRALLARNLRFRAISVIEFGGRIASNIAAIVAAYAGWGLWALVVQSLGYQVLVTAGFWIALPWWPGRFRRGSDVGDLLKFGANVVGVGAFNHLGRNFDKIVLGRTIGSEGLGYYSRAYQLLLYPISAINAPLASVMLAALSRLQNDLPRLRAAYTRVMQAVVAITFPAVTMMAALREELILTAYGEKWIPAIPIFGILALAGCVQPLGNSTGWLFMATGNPGRQLRWGLVMVPLQSIAVLIGARWGALGVAVAYASVTILLAWPAAWYSYSTVDMRVWDVWRKFVPQFIAALGAGGVAALTREVLIARATLPHWSRLIIGSITGSAGYIILLSMLWRGWTKEVRSIIDLIMKRSNLEQVRSHHSSSRSQERPEQRSED